MAAKRKRTNVGNFSCFSVLHEFMSMADRQTMPYHTHTHTCTHAHTHALLFTPLNDVIVVYC